MRTIAALFLSFSLLGCSATPTQVSTFYDYQLATPTGERISLQRLPAEIENADVILVGEGIPTQVSTVSRLICLSR